MNRVLFFSLIAQPFQIFRALTIGALYFKPVSQIVLLVLNLIIEVIIVIIWRPSIDPLDDFVHISGNLCVTMICGLSFWQDPMASTLMMLTALFMVGSNVVALLYQNWKQIKITMKRIKSIASSNSRVMEAFGDEENAPEEKTTSKRHRNLARGANDECMMNLESALY